MYSVTLCSVRLTGASQDGEQRAAGLIEPPLDSDQLLYRRHAAVTRRKRNILFPSGVKLCTQETFEQAVTNHLNYFHLRGTSLCCALCLCSSPFSVLAWLHVQKFPFFPCFSLSHTRGVSLKLLSKQTYELKLQVLPSLKAADPTEVRGQRAKELQKHDLLKESFGLNRELLFFCREFTVEHIWMFDCREKTCLQVQSRAVVKQTLSAGSKRKTVCSNEKIFQLFHH